MSLVGKGLPENHLCASRPSLDGPHLPSRSPRTQRLEARVELDSDLCVLIEKEKTLKRKKNAEKGEGDELAQANERERTQNRR